MSTKAKRRIGHAPPWEDLGAERNRGLLGSVVERLGLRILDGTYGPERALPTEPALMAELKISRTVLREAIKILGAKGLLTSRPKSGTHVRPARHWNLLDPTILELYCRVVDYSEFAKNFQSLRVVIEPEAAAMAATHGSRTQLKLLSAAYAAMEAAKNLKEWTAADLGFHEAILEATGNPFMQPLRSLIRAALNTLLFHSAKTSANPFDSLSEHKQVLDAIQRRDAAGARSAMKTLLAGTELSVSKTLRSGRSSDMRPAGETRHA